jgi:hypothetical protein
MNNSILHYTFFFVIEISFWTGKSTMHNSQGCCLFLKHVEKVLPDIIIVVGRPQSQMLVKTIKKLTS